ncbi:MAG: histidine phosphatase family protein [Solirubrobacterales bacterium]
MIYLLRHGEAEPESAGGDSARRLTAKGETQAANAGRALAALGIKLDSCLTSPRVRARDTAELACHSLTVKPEIVESIGYGEYDTVDLAAGRGEMLLVGHEPVLSMEVARLTGARIKMKKGGLVILEPNLLRALLRPAELAAIAGAAGD